MRAVLTGDVHLTDSPEDEYRWKALKNLGELAWELDSQAIFILGDLTDRKDKHSARLVNRLCQSIMGLASIAPVHILKGNHDYVDPNCPFMGFVHNFKGVNFHSDYYSDPAGRYIMLPHTRTPDEDWKYLDMSSPLVLLHQTFNGAVASNGMAMDGDLKTDWFRNHKGMVISGDIHVPQKIGRVRYVGAPHPVRFGDAYDPRFLSYDSGKIRSHKAKTIRKWTTDVIGADDLYMMDIDKGDHLKLTLLLSPTESHLWENLRQEIMEAAEDLGAHISSLVPKVTRPEGKDVSVAVKKSLPKTVEKYLEDQGVELELVEHILERAYENIQNGN